MRRRVFVAAVIMLAAASVGTATYVAVLQTKPKARPSSATAQKGAAQRDSTKKGTTTQGRNATATAAPPIRPADPNLAPQPAVDEALYTSEEFFGVTASVARPYTLAYERIMTLATQYPKDARLKLQAARLAE